MTDAPIRDRLLTAATELAHEGGWPEGIGRDRTAARACCSSGMVNWVYGSIDGLRDAVMTDAIDRRDLVLLAQGLARASSIARAAPEEMRRAALTEMMGI